MNVKIIDAIGQIHYPKNYERIISLIPSITETLFELGVGKQVVGVTEWCIYPPEARDPPRTIIQGGTKNPSIKQIKELDPDLIILSKEENRKKTYEQLKEIAPIYVIFPQTVKESVEMIIDLAKLLKKNEDENVRKKIENVLKTIQIIEKHVENLEEKTIFVPVWKDPWMTFGNDTYMFSFFKTLKLRSIFDDMKRYPRVTIEQIVSRKPDYIVLPSEPCHFTEKDKQFLHEKIGIPLDNIILVEGSYVTWYGIRTAKGLKHMAKKIYPKIF